MSQRIIRLVMACVSLLLCTAAARAQTWQADLTAGKDALAQGRAGEAEALLAAALRKAEAAGTSEVEHDDILENLIFALMRQAKLADAEQYARRRAKALPAGSDDLTAIRARKTLANILYAQGSMYEATSRVLGKQPGPQLGVPNSEVARPGQPMGQREFFVHKFSEAEGILKDVLPLERRQLGESHADVGDTYHQLARIYKALGRNQEAEAHYQQALHIFEIVHSDSLPFLLDSFGTFYAGRNNDLEAEKMLQRALTLMRQRGESGPTLGGCAQNLARVLYRLKRYAASELLYAEVVAIWAESFGKDSPALVGPLEAYKRTLDKQKKKAEANEVGKRIGEIRRQNPGLIVPE